MGTITNLSGNVTKYEIIATNTVKKPKISIILPVYNVEKYLVECIDSILNQSMKDIEIICINDGSTDKSLKILKEFYKKNSNHISLITQKNAGAGVARNAGLAIAKGEYLLFMDSDDMLVPDALEVLYNQAKRDDLDVLIFNCMYYDNQTQQASVKPWTVKAEMIPQEQIFSSKEYCRYIYNCSPNWAWNKLFKKSFIDSHNLIFQDSVHTNDTYFTCVALALANRISILNEHLLLYRVNQKNSLTSKNVRNKNYLEIVKVLSAIQEKLIKDNKYALVKQSFDNLVLEQFRYNISKTSGLSRWLLIFFLKYKYFEYFDLNKIDKKNIYDGNLVNTLDTIKKFSILKEIFSVQNQSKGNLKYKVITVFGIKIKIKRRGK